MSIDNAKSFLRTVNTDTGLRTKLKAIHEEAHLQAVEKIVAVAAEHGHTFTAAEFARAVEALAAELSPEELAKVAGGVPYPTQY